ncbi:hypothetical protein [Caballeronia temeraria]|uniref:hypothetical protein n=1 Tax=Caballeronia temeraria TaxID=1777137 RepID=UPI0012FD2FE7|nr:hypothetical protein [Caballeronia temeraria]
MFVSLPKLAFDVSTLKGLLGGNFLLSLDVGGVFSVSCPRGMGFFGLLWNPVFLSVYWHCPYAGRQSLSLLLQRK